MLSMLAEKMKRIRALLLWNLLLPWFYFTSRYIGAGDRQRMFMCNPTAQQIALAVFCFVLFICVGSLVLELLYRSRKGDQVPIHGIKYGMLAPMPTKLRFIIISNLLGVVLLESFSQIVCLVAR